MSEKVGTINTYLGLSKSESTSEAPPGSFPAGQQRILILGVLNGNPNGIPYPALQSIVSSSMNPDALRDILSDLRKKGLADIEVGDDPLNPTVKITQKGQEQLSFLS